MLSDTLLLLVIFIPISKCFSPSKHHLFEPMDQGVISVLKAYDLRRTFAQAIDTAEEDPENTLDAILEGLQHL